MIFPGFAHPLLLIMTLLGYQLFSLGQKRTVKPYFSCNLRILFMDYKHVMLYIRWNPKSWSGELRMLNIATSWEVLCHSCPAEKESNRMENPHRWCPGWESPVCNACMHKQEMIWRRQICTQDMMYTDNLPFNLQVLAWCYTKRLESRCSF